ncbi:MAG: hypothetical protein ACPLTR_04675, partial [Thermacetogeniaceae bacterium]
TFWRGFGMNVIDVSQARLSKVSVEIQVVRVGDKQMTLAVFRQLEKEPLINWRTLRFRGIPWGWVNYHKGCLKRFEHLHIIWQDGERLLRDDVYWRHPYETRYHQANEARARGFLADALAVGILRSELEGASWESTVAELKERGTAVCVLDGEDLDVSVGDSDALLKAVRCLSGESEGSRVEAESLLKERYGCVPEFQDLLEKARAALKADALDEWDKLYDSLRKLPQLFIAV